LIINIGTILRSYDGAKVDAVLVCNKKAKLTNQKLIKASMGAVFTVPIIEFSNAEACITWLSKHQFTIYLADTRADKAYKNYEYGGNTALIVGGERYGISKEWYSCESQLLSIPMHGICDSLNVGVATSIFLYELCMNKQ